MYEIYTVFAVYCGRQILNCVSLSKEVYFYTLMSSTDNIWLSRGREEMTTGPNSRKYIVYYYFFFSIRMYVLYVLNVILYVIYVLNVIYVLYLSIILILYYNIYLYYTLQYLFYS